MYKLITKREKIMGTPTSTATKIKYFTEALEKAAFINIDGFEYRIMGFYKDIEQELHFEDEESGEMYVNTLDELVADMHEIQLSEIKRIWG